MAKRSTDRPADDGEQAYLKRQKIKHVSSSTEDIQSSRQLQQLLAFDQNIERARHGIQSFKVFLESFSEEDAKKGRLPILKDYLQSQMPQDKGDEAAVYMEDIMKTWSFASQSNNDSLLSAVPAVLALLFRTLSSMVDFTPYGLRLGRILLKQRQLELLSRGLASNKAKDYIISPSLRLIREVTSFDGGVLVKDAYRARDYTYKALARNIGLRHVGDDVEDPKKPSVRTHALRFLFACMKFLPTKAKNEVFSLRDVVSGITRDISSDPPYLIVELLETLKVHVLQDESLTRDAKSKLLYPANLGRIATLYGYDQDDGKVQQGRKPISAVAHEFLVVACTTPNMGVLYSKAAFYPRGIDPDEGRNLENQNIIDLGLESLKWADKFIENVPVRNAILSEFIQSLRPWSDIKQSELLVAIFKAAPELVADYFFRKKSFTFEPKLTATWMGYSSFLFSVILLPIPPYFGNQDKYGRIPPPSSIVIESVLPQPLTQKALTRCLNRKSSLITFCAIRLLIVAFQKLQEIIRQYRKAADTGSPIWIQAEHQLTELFCQRCPAMKDVIITFNSIPENNLIQRQAASRLLSMYYESVPQIALESKFDVSARLTEALRLMEISSAKREDRAIRVIEVESLFQIAHFSPGMRWFNKPEPFPISPFSAMLQLSVQASSELPLLKIREILDSVINESGIMQVQTQQSSKDALVAALKACNGKGGLQLVYEFLDNCVLRCSITPVKYIDALEQYSNSVYGEETENSAQQTGPVSLLLLAIAEQLPFIMKSSETKTMEEVLKFIANYVAASIKILEDEKIIKAITKALASVCPEGSKARKIIERSYKLVDTLELPKPPVPSAKSPEISDSNRPKEQTSEEIEESMLQTTAVEVDDHSALTRWVTKEMEDVIEEGHAAALIMLLSSPHLIARKEAISNIAKLALKLQSSSYDEREQIWLLLSEVVETAKPHVSDQSLPTVITAFASHALSVLRDPLHCLYPKVNQFLSQGPTWEADKFPLLHAILNEPPTIDDAHYSEVSFLLTYLASGLQTAADMAIFHKRHVFEKLLTFYNNPYLGKNLKEKILRVLWRATAVEGGSTTLITRLSVLSWLQAQMRVESGNKGLRVLMERILKTCDEEKLKAWSHRSVVDFLAELQ